MVGTELESMGGVLLGKAEGIDQDLAGLLIKLEALQDFWVSPAASEFAPYFANWSNAARDMFGPDGILGQVANALNVSWNNYTECEGANVKGWQTA